MWCIRNMLLSILLVCVSTFLILYAKAGKDPEFRRGAAPTESEWIHRTSLNTSYTITPFVYGKYYSKIGTAKATECNTYYFFRPVKSGMDLPFVLQFHGGGMFV